MPYRLFLFALVCLPVNARTQEQRTPEQTYGQLFIDVQLRNVFPDSKTFVDMLPKRDPKAILKDYLSQKKEGIDLKKFVEDNFTLPITPQLNYIRPEKDATMHIRNLWQTLTREPDKKIEGSSLLPLPYAYVVPGGRFREIYYWDSYFTLLGLKEHGQYALIENMIRNFAYLIDTYGHIPNGNRTYYLSRSQPPYFALMVELLAGIKGDQVLREFLPQMEKEYAYWMEGATELKKPGGIKRVVLCEDGSLLNRYWDENNTPRTESYREDVATATEAGKKKEVLYRELRAGAASGWDFSSRWLKIDNELKTIQTTSFLPVDLNCLLYSLERTIADAKLLNNEPDAANTWNEKAEKRRSAIDRYCWNRELKFYTDYNFVTGKSSERIHPGGLFPFALFEGKPDYMSLLARQAAERVRSELLQPGGLRTTSIHSGQQWDAPNGWAPLQWMSIWGLNRCGQRELAREIAKRWISLNLEVYKRTGKLMEKYNVEDLGLDAGGGEYPSQDGFGWTNGVLIALIRQYGIE
jgi:alpha,alpha-trehalase